jgi:hypothetical protein
MLARPVVEGAVMGYRNDVPIAAPVGFPPENFQQVTQIPGLPVVIDARADVNFFPAGFAPPPVQSFTAPTIYHTEEFVPKYTTPATNRIAPNFPKAIFPTLVTTPATQVCYEEGIEPTYYQGPTHGYYYEDATEPVYYAGPSQSYYYTEDGTRPHYDEANTKGYSYEEATQPSYYYEEATHPYYGEAIDQGYYEQSTEPHYYYEAATEAYYSYDAIPSSYEAVSQPYYYEPSTARPNYYEPSATARPYHYEANTMPYYEGYEEKYEATTTVYATTAINYEQYYEDTTPKPYYEPPPAYRPYTTFYNAY